MHHNKPDFKKMTDKERAAFLKTVQKRTSTKSPKVSYMTFNKTTRPTFVSTELDAKFNTSMKRYRNHIDTMIVLGFSNPAEPTFRDEVINDMKNVYSMYPDELMRMHNKEWIVDDIIQKMVKKHTSKKGSASKKVPVKPSTSTKTKALLESRRRQQKQDARKKPPVVAPNSNSSNSNNNNNNNNGGFNMNNNNRNNNNAKSNNMSNNNNNKNKNSAMSNNDVKKLMNNLKNLNMSVLRV